MVDGVSLFIELNIYIILNWVRDCYELPTLLIWPSSFPFFLEFAGTAKIAFSI